ncbi:fimbrial protein [Salmonella enterica]|nr:fimbrial protein [Salmonella enterica]
MRNKILSAMVAAGMMMYGASAFAVDTVTPTAGTTAPTIASSTITVHGHVNDSPCDITGGGNVDINYNQVSNKHISKDPSYEHPFTIHLENCTFASGTSTPKVSVTFASNSGVDTTGKIIMAGSTGVGVQISDNNAGATTDHFVNFNSPVPHEISFPANSKEMNLNFSTWLVQAGTDAVKTGDFSATATYTLTYS